MPFLPAAWHGREVAVIAVLYVGDMAEGERQLAALPALESRSRMSSGRRRSQDSRPRNYWKSHDLRALTDATIDGIVHFVGRLPSLHCEIFVAHLGGAVARVAPDATAFGRRDTEFVLNVHIRWEHASDDAHCIGWGREFFTAMAPHAMGSVYVNIMSEDETDRVQAAFDRNFARLATVKAKYDPQNLFRMNQNSACGGIGIRPSPHFGAGMPAPAAGSGELTYRVRPCRR